MVKNVLEMARVFNEYFGLVFTREDTSNIPAVNTETQNEVVQEIEIAEKKYRKM